MLSVAAKEITDQIPPMASCTRVGACPSETKYAHFKIFEGVGGGGRRGRKGLFNANHNPSTRIEAKGSSCAPKGRKMKSNSEQLFLCYFGAEGKNYLKTICNTSFPSDQVLNDHQTLSVDRITG